MLLVLLGVYPSTALLILLLFSSFSLSPDLSYAFCILILAL
jgi:hypothetical protein